MATLIFSALGTLVGGPLGGVIGALAGRQIDAAIIGSGNVQGPRLKDLTVTTSTYGEPIPRHFGRMRVAGSIIWSTGLVESSQTSGGGKGKPSVTSYSYASSFAVALASRPLRGIGRIWADGKLLRGAAGDLKTGGTLRIYPGHHDQHPDPLIASAEGADRCPAFRGLAYVVFENLQLADYSNRIPSLSFEVLADDGALSLQPLFDEVAADIDAGVPLGSIAGYSCTGPFDATLAQFQPILPMDCNAGGDQLVIAPARLQNAPIALAEPAASADRNDFGARAGFTRQRQPRPIAPAKVLRYYDVDRDYQPATQRAPGQPLTGQPRTLDLPATLAAGDAFTLIAEAARRDSWANDTLAWRTTVLDPAVAPGTIVTAPGQPGQWRVTDWEWRAGGVELSLVRASPLLGTNGLDGYAGRAAVAADLTITPTILAAFELPWDGAGAGTVPLVCAAASSAGAGWAGAELFVDHGDGQLVSLGSSGRSRALIGHALAALPGASPLLVDRQNSIDVALAGPDFALTSASPRQLAQGANRALLGAEIIQFARCEPLGAGVWRLSHLLRGRGGTEGVVGTHAAGETFVLLDAELQALDPADVGSGPATRIAALGLGDPAAVEVEIACRGITLRPLSPVHAARNLHPDGSLTLGWVRRARGAWQWLDGVEVPLQEQAESYQVGLGDPASPAQIWNVTAPALTIDAATLAALHGALPGGRFFVRQQGTFALSDPLDLGPLP
ncbi:MAG: hypothetical protein JSS36_11590 [Proteobacteria bacterium]|nr:hypothetical protein [Pseudomonadota bacterium]